MAFSDVQSILVPVDSSPDSRLALEQAVALISDYFGATIDVLQVREGTEDTERLLADLARRGLAKIQRIPAAEPEAKTILEAVEKSAYDLIVMGPEAPDGTFRRAVQDVLLSHRRKHPMAST